jgi:hypothetical protein
VTPSEESVSAPSETDTEGVIELDFPSEPDNSNENGGNP